MKPNIFVFDCESVSLHGPTFAVGAIVLEQETRNEVARFELLAEEGLPLCNDWVKENVLPHLSGMPACKTMKELRDRFFEFYMEHKESCDIYSDVNFPVETNFLSAVVADDPSGRQLQMPYHLYDIVNDIPIEIERIKERGLSGLRKHHPLDDARASAACFLNKNEVLSSHKM